VLAAALHAQTSPLSARPSRIVSLVPALTEMLFAVGAGPQVVGVSSFDHYPPEVLSRPRVGALLDPDVERILGLRPDLVVVYGSQSDLERQMRRAEIPVYSYRHGDLEHVTDTLRELGARVGHASDAERVAAAIDQRLHRVRMRVAGLPRPRVLLVFGREPGSLRNIYASGGYGFLQDMLTLAGGQNVFGDVKKESVQATSELILARKPDVILEVRPSPPDGTNETAGPDSAWATLSSVPAVRLKRITILTGDQFVVPGPRVAEGAERMAEVLHPSRP
jgi:iron complex transport system substrate-binding protein